MYIVHMYMLCQIHVHVVITVLLTLPYSLFIQLMEKNYRHSNAYHNSTHAADVLQGTAYLIRSLQEETVSYYLIILSILVYHTEGYFCGYTNFLFFMISYFGKCLTNKNLSSL